MRQPVAPPTGPRLRILMLRLRLFLQKTRIFKARVERASIVFYNGSASRMDNVTNEHAVPITTELAAKSASPFI